MTGVLVAAGSGGGLILPHDELCRWSDDIGGNVAWCVVCGSGTYVLPSLSTPKNGG